MKKDVLPTLVFLLLLYDCLRESLNTHRLFASPYWEKLCPRSWIPPEAAKQRAQFFPIFLQYNERRAKDSDI